MFASGLWSNDLDAGQASLAVATILIQEGLGYNIQSDSWPGQMHPDNPQNMPTSSCRLILFPCCTPICIERVDNLGNRFQSCA